MIDGFKWGANDLAVTADSVTSELFAQGRKGETDTVTLTPVNNSTEERKGTVIAVKGAEASLRLSGHKAPCQGERDAIRQ